MRSKTVILLRGLIALCLICAASRSYSYTIPCDPSNSLYQANSDLRDYCDRIEGRKPGDSADDRKINLYYYAPDRPGAKISATFSIASFLALDEAAREQWIYWFIKAVDRDYAATNAAWEAANKLTDRRYDLDIWKSQLQTIGSTISNMNLPSSGSYEQFARDAARRTQVLLDIRRQMADLTRLMDELNQREDYYRNLILRGRWNGGCPGGGNACASSSP